MLWLTKMLCYAPLLACSVASCTEKETARMAVARPAGTHFRPSLTSPGDACSSRSGAHPSQGCGSQGGGRTMVVEAAPAPPLIRRSPTYSTLSFPRPPQPLPTPSAARSVSAARHSGRAAALRTGCAGGRLGSSTLALSTMTVRVAGGGGGETDRCALRGDCTTRTARGQNSNEVGCSSSREVLTRPMDGKSSPKTRALHESISRHFLFRSNYANTRGVHARSVGRVGPDTVLLLLQLRGCSSVPHAHRDSRCSPSDLYCTADALAFTPHLPPLPMSPLLSRNPTHTLLFQTSHVPITPSSERLHQNLENYVRPRRPWAQRH